MPRIPSAKKRQRQSKVRTARNKAQRSTLRTSIKKVATAGTKAEAAEALKAATTQLDRAGRKNLVHKNVAARTKSRLARMVNARDA